MSMSPILPISETPTLGTAKIKNRDALLSHGFRRGREIVIDLAEHALEAVDSYKAVKELVRLSGQTLTVGSLKFDLSSASRIYVIGAGKASLGMARALDEVLGDRIENGVVVVKHQTSKLRRIEVVKGGHPIPDKGSYVGAKKTLEITRNLTQDDLVFSVISGGSSALLSYPVKGISLHDERKVTKLLLNSGASILEINAVRRHISAINGGRLAQRIHPAKLINLIISDDVFGHSAIKDPSSPRNWQGTPVCFDPTTFEQAISVLRKYDLWREIPKSVRTHLGGADSSMETPKNFDNAEVHNFVLRNIANSCEGAEERARQLGLGSLILTTALEGDSKEVGIVLAKIAMEIEKNSRPLKPPCVVICGGETTVTIAGRSKGRGGPSQELALGFATKISGDNRVVLLAIDTDGTDGPTDIAGAIVDGDTIPTANQRALDVSKTLRRHDSSSLLRQLDSAVVTGPTETNVCDLNLLYVSD